MIKEIRYKALTLAALALALSMSSCGGKGDAGYAPRPQAYPRIEFPDSVYVPIEIGGVTMLFNDSTEIHESPSGAMRGAWIDVRYKCLTSPELYLTLTQSDDTLEIAEALENRRERLALNLGQERAELIELTSRGGWDCQLVVARASVTTPVQVLAWRHGEMLSGALVVNVPDSLRADPAYIAPVVEGVERDMLVLLKNL